MATFALSELLNAPVYDATGTRSGRVREVALRPQDDRARVFSLIVKTGSGERMLPADAILSVDGGVRASTASA